MKKLLAIEFAKLKKLNSLRVILLMYFGLSPLVAYAFYTFFDFIAGPFLGENWNPFAFPDVWSFVTWCSSWFNVLMGVIVVIVMTNEYSYKTLKQNVIDGMSLRQVIVGKFIVVFLLSTIVTIYTFIMSLVFGLLNSESSVDIWNGFVDIPVYYLQTLCYFSFAFLFAILVKRSALSIIFFIVSFIVESILGGILKVMNLEYVYAFFPLNAFSKLTPFPILKEMVKAAEERNEGNGDMPFLLDDGVNILLCLLYMTLFFFISFWVIKRRDL
jgi:ABC-2 type transport system permease protein